MTSGAFTNIFALLKSLVSVEVQCWFCLYDIDHWEDGSLGDECGPCSPRPTAYRALLANLEIEDKLQDLDVAWVLDYATCSVHDSLAAPLAKISSQLHELKLVQVDPARIDEDPIKVAGHHTVPRSKLLGQDFNSITHLDISLTSELNWPVRYRYSERAPNANELLACLRRMLRSAPNEITSTSHLACNLNQMYSRRGHT